jgi:hypothetical protein
MGTRPRFVDAQSMAVRAVLGGPLATLSLAKLSIDSQSLFDHTSAALVLGHTAAWKYLKVLLPACRVPNVLLAAGTVSPMRRNAIGRRRRYATPSC